VTEPFRPTATEKFTRCPTKWYYEDVQGWRLPPGGRFPVEQLIGTSLHAGMAEYWRGRQGHEAEPRKVAQATLAGGWQETAEQSLEGISQLLDRVLDATIAHCAQHMRYEDALLIEQPMRPDGHTTPDLVTREITPSSDRIIITDYKYHHEVEGKNLPYRLEGDERKHQFRDYHHVVSEYLGEKVGLIRVLHIVGLPKVLIRENNFTYSPESQAEWLRQAKVKWHQMAQMKAGGELHGGLTWRNENGCLQFGSKWPCEMFTACWECHGNQEQMAQFYVKGDQG